MNLILFGLFLVLPVVELALAIKVGTVIGVLPTVGLMVLSALAGSWLMRQQGAQALADLQRAFAELRDPSPHLAGGALILLAGALMVAPGFLTDLIGLALLLPPVRRAVIRWAGQRVAVRATGGYAGAGFGAGFRDPQAAHPAGQQPPPDFAPGMGAGGFGPTTPGGQPHRPGGGVIIDAEFHEVDPDFEPDTRTPGDTNATPRRPSGWTRG